MGVDVLAIGAHPDDVELGAGGTLASITATGGTVAVLDLTRGERASRGSVEERATEAAKAGQILGVQERHNADLPDGELADVAEQRLAIVCAIREVCPRVILAHMDGDRHPDHNAAHALCCSALFGAGLYSLDTGQEPFRAAHIYFYRPYLDNALAPSFLVDVSGVYERKVEALQAYRSQFANPAYEGPETFVASTAFWEAQRTRAAYWGARAGVAYAEPFFAQQPVLLGGLPGMEPV